MKNSILLLAITFCFLRSGNCANSQLGLIGPIILQDGANSELLAGSQKVEKDSFMIVDLMPQLDKNAQKVEKDTTVQRKIIIKKSNSANKQADMDDLSKMFFKDSAQFNAYKKLVAKNQEIFKEHLPEYMEKLREAQIAVFKSPMNAQRGERSSGFNMIEGFTFDQPGKDRVVVVGGGVMSGKEGETDNSMLRLSKSFKGESVESIKKFSVNANYTALNLQLNGEVKTGVITVTLIKPNGTIFKSIEIDATSDVSFNQMLDLKKNPMTGDWQIKIKADKVEGNYRLTILTR